MTINYRRTARLRLGLWLFVTTLFFAAPVEAKVTRYVTGNAGDVAPTLAGPAHDLGGGGTDVDAAIQ